MADEEEKEVNNSMSDLEAAWEQHESSEETVLEEPLEAKDEEPAGQESDTEVTAAAGPDDSEGGGDAERKADGDGVQEAGESAAPTEQVRPPVSWKAGAREHWKDLPKEVQEEIARREQDMNIGMRRNSEAAQRGSAYDQIMNKYQSMFAATGQTPFQVVETVVQTAAMLQGGTPAHKAQVVVDIIKQYGIDVGTIDNLLVGEPVGEGVAQQSAIDAAVQQAIQPYQQQYQQQQAAQQRAHEGVQYTANTEVDSFSADPKNEFYADVRNDMADLMDLASKRGMELTLQQAYDRACAARPDVTGVLNARRSAKNLLDKKRAASTISGTPGGTQTTEAPESLRGAIDLAWENAGRV